MAITPPATYIFRAEAADGSGAQAYAATKQLSSAAATGVKTFVYSSASIDSRYGFAIAVTGGSSPQTITATGIASGEAFGSTRVNLTIGVSGIASEEAFGDLVITTPEPQFIAPVGIASGETFGTLTTVLYLGPSGIATAEAVGTPRLAALIGPVGIASGEAFGSIGLIMEQFIVPTGIASGEAFGALTLQLGYPQTIEVFGIESGEVVEDPSISLLHRLVLINPSIQETPAAWHRLFARYGIHRGITIMKDASGVWASVRYPSQTEIEEAQTTYMGGHRHALTSAEADELIAAGYGQYLSLELIE